MSSRENLASKRGKFARQRNKMAAKLDLLRIHLHRQPNANTKQDAQCIGMYAWCCDDARQRDSVIVCVTTFREYILQNVGNGDHA